ncbi:MAG TPA: ABC transporter permease [Burkholderiales bacterium]|jgi:ABC-type transport system involved in multi-copper enzyme maturation permease subunit
MPAAIFARLALLEARRGGLLWLALLSVGAGLGLGAFLSQLAVTESRMLQAAVVAAVLRVCAVFIIAAQVIASVRREIDDKRLELMLSLPWSRATQYLGRLAGFAACAAILALAFALPLLLWAAPAAVACWSLSLGCELVLVAAAALFFAMTLAQLVPALAATAGLYFLARSVSAMQAIAAGPLAEETLAHELARRAVDALALLLPALDGVTRAEWLLYGLPEWRAYAFGLAGVLLYALLLAAAGVFDFERRAT